MVCVDASLRVGVEDVVVLRGQAGSPHSKGLAGYDRVANFAHTLRAQRCVAGARFPIVAAEVAADIRLLVGVLPGTLHAAARTHGSRSISVPPPYSHTPRVKWARHRAYCACVYHPPRY